MVENFLFILKFKPSWKVSQPTGQKEESKWSKPSRNHNNQLLTMNRLLR